MEEIKFSIPFVCDEKIRPHLISVFQGEYDIPIFVPGLKILDLGANVGAFCAWAAYRFPRAEILAYEPHPENFKLLQENTKCLDIQTYNWAIGKPGTRILYDGMNNCGEASLHLMQNNSKRTGQHVEVKDPLTLKEADILKIDTEGCELEILEPLIRAGRKFSAVMLEYHTVQDRRLIDCLLLDYVLIGAQCYSPGRGVLKYLHKNLVQE